MALVSGPTLNNAISDQDNALAKLAASEMDDEQLVRQLFLRVLTRTATSAEIAMGVETLRSVPLEHERLLSEFRVYQEYLKPITAQKEQERLAKIDKAKAILTAYEQELAPRLAELEKKKQEKTKNLTEEFEAYEATLPQQLVKWEKEKLAEKTVWVPLDPHELSSTFGAKLTREKDLSVIASEKNGVGSYKFVAETDLIGITAVRIEVLADKRLPKNGPGRNDDGNFVLTELEFTAAPMSDPTKVAKVALQNSKADFSQAVYDVKTAIDGKLENINNGWGASPKLGVDHVATFELKEPIGDRDGSSC